MRSAPEARARLRPIRLPRRERPLGLGVDDGQAVSVSTLDKLGNLSLPCVRGDYELHKCVLDDWIATERPIVVPIGIVNLASVQSQLPGIVGRSLRLFHGDGNRLFNRGCVRGLQDEQIETHAGFMPQTARFESRAETRPAGLRSGRLLPSYLAPESLRPAPRSEVGEFA
jgi:hypothetical protein